MVVPLLLCLLHCCLLHPRLNKRRIGASCQFVLETTKMDYLMKQLLDLKNKYWISVSPLARINDECWVVSVYKKCKSSWVTEECNSFPTPELAYQWGFNHIEQIKLK